MSRFFTMLRIPAFRSFGSVGRVRCGALGTWMRGGKGRALTAGGVECRVPMATTSLRQDTSKAGTLRSPCMWGVLPFIVAHPGCRLPHASPLVPMPFVRELPCTEQSNPRLWPLCQPRDRAYFTWFRLAPTMSSDVKARDVGEPLGPPT